MEKEGFKDIFNSRSGKINLALLFSIVLIFVLMSIYANGLTVTLNSPANLSYNGSRNVNFTFTTVWSLTGETVQNCSIFTNITSAAGTQTAVNTTGNNIVNSSTLLSWINFTFASDGNYTYSIACVNSSDAGVFTFTTNRTFFLDSVAPTITLDTPKGGVLSDASAYNITSYETGTFYINISDNSTNTVWMVLNSAAFTIGIQPVAGANESINRSLTAGAVIAQPDNKQYYFTFNSSGVLNFNSSFTSPGSHSVSFCANDSLGRITCTNRSDFIIKGMNVTQMETIFATMKQFDAGGSSAGPAFGGLNITLGNGTEIPEGTFMNPIDGITVGGLTHKNFTFIFNISNEIKIHIVGGSVDESQFANASRSSVNSTPTAEIRQQLGTRYSSTMAWADIASFIPSQVSYQYGIIQLGGTSFSKKMYCSGTTTSNPQCHTISQCSGNVFGVVNNSAIIPTDDGCWLESGTINGEALSSGYTYLFVDHFSGGLGGADFGQPNTTFISPSNDQFARGTNTSVAQNRVINFTVDDTDSTGLNLTANQSINVSITLGGTQLVFFSFFNSTTTNLSCDSVTDRISLQNTTKIQCNVTYNFGSNGTYLINVTGRDTSNNSNVMNTTTSFTRLTVDNIAPLFGYFNITNSSTFNTSSTEGSDINEVKTFNNSPGGSAIQGTRIFLTVNWTDNLTKPLRGDWQVLNNSEWVTINSSLITSSNSTIPENGGWLNLSYVLQSGHNIFEGANVTFRIRANDTVGNMNTSTTTITIQVNDTTKPSLIATIQGFPDLNGTNISDTTPTILWNVTESRKLRYIAIQVDGSTDTGCNKFINFTGNVELKRNNSDTPLTVSSDAGCPLANGTRIIRLTAEDTWGNYELYIHSFTVQSGVNPTLTFDGSEDGSVRSNQSTITSNTGINFSALVGGNSPLKNISFTSSCNSTGGLFTNNTAIKPFQDPSCVGSTGNRTIDVTAYDFSGNSIANRFQFLVDDTPPSLSINAPRSVFIGDNNITINLSAKDDVSNISRFGYYLDGAPLVYLNWSAFPGGQTYLGYEGQNVTNVFAINFTPGTHTVVFTASDGIGGGAAVNNTANRSVTFTVTGPVEFSQVHDSAVSYISSVFDDNLTNVSIRIKQGDGTYANISVSNYTNASTYEILFEINGTINVTLTDINGSAANWDKINFTPYTNQTTHVPWIQNNWTTTILRAVWFNSSIGEFIGNNNSYYGIVVFPYNNSDRAASGPEFWWIPNENDVTTKTNITQCTSAFTRTTTTPCWNYTANGKTIIQVPHFSIVQAVNDTSAPTINVTIPADNGSIGMFIPNITVSQDAASCTYSINGTVANKTMAKSGNVCLGATERFKNLTVSDGSYNFTFYVTDKSGNLNTYQFKFNISDTTSPNNGLVTSSPGTTTATVTITGTNESVNATVNYGTVNTSLGSSAVETDFNVTQTVTLSSLTASSTYYFNITVCDFNGNCKTNSSVFSFATSAAAAEAAAAAAASSSGGGGGGAAAPSNEVATASRRWDSLAAGSSAVLTINKGDIAVTGVSIDVKNAVTNAELKVASLASSPIATAAAAKVYQYLQITKSNIADADASKITINFKVLKSWLTTNGIKEDDVVLYRYSDSTWNALATSKTGEDANNFVYQSATPGFSTFAIGGKEAAPEAPVAAPEAPVAAPEAPVAAPEAPSAPIAAPSAPAGLSTTTIAWIVVAVIVVIAAIGYFMMQRKKE